jgi:tetratricopeptide (TPR) repeat protein
MAQLAQRGDERGLAKAHLAMFTRHWLMSRAIPAAVEVKLAAEHARKAGDGGLRARALAWYLASNLYGPMPVAEMVAELDEIEAEPGEYLHAFVACNRSVINRFAQRFESARAWAHTATDRFSAMGTSLLGWGWLHLSEVEKAVGDYPAAIDAAQRGDRVLDEAGERAFRSTSQAMLADLYAANGDRPAAEQAIALTDELSADDDLVNFAITHRVRSALALHDGDLETAQRWAQSAIDYAYDADFPLHRGDARMQLARVLAALGRVDEAAAEAQTSLDLYSAKGDRNGADLAGTLLTDLQQRPRPAPG